MPANILPASPPETNPRVIGLESSGSPIWTDGVETWTDGEPATPDEVREALGGIPHPYDPTHRDDDCTRERDQRRWDAGRRLCGHYDDPDFANVSCQYDGTGMCVL